MVVVGRKKAERLSGERKDRCWAEQSLAGIGQSAGRIRPHTNRLGEKGLLAAAWTPSVSPHRSSSGLARTSRAYAVWIRSWALWTAATTTGVVAFKRGAGTRKNPGGVDVGISMAEMSTDQSVNHASDSDDSSTYPGDDNKGDQRDGRTICSLLDDRSSLATQ